jgi:hypothetical protein
MERRDQLAPLALFDAAARVNRAIQIWTLYCRGDWGELEKLLWPHAKPKERGRKAREGELFAQLQGCAGLGPGEEESYAISFHFTAARGRVHWKPMPQTLFAAACLRLIELCADRTIREYEKSCAAPGCERSFAVRTGPGRPREFCDSHIRNKRRLKNHPAQAGEIHPGGTS